MKEQPMSRRKRQVQETMSSPQEALTKREKRQLKKEVRRFPIWFRIFALFSACLAAAIIGSMIGYSFLGNGAALDVLRPETWIHIFDLYRGVE